MSLNIPALQIYFYLEYLGIRYSSFDAKEVKMKLKIVLEQGMDGYITAYCPALKGCVTQGKTEEEAVKNLKEAIELYLEADPMDIMLPEDKYKVSELAI